MAPNDADSQVAASNTGSSREREESAARRAATAAGQLHGKPTDAVYKKGDKIEVFFRFEHVKDRDFEEPLFPVWSPAAALQYPRIGLTDGWLPAVVERDFPPEASTSSTNGKKSSAADHVQVQLCHKLWGNRKGDFHRNGESDLRPLRSVRVADVRRRAADALPPKISFVCLRWGVWSPYHDKDGAWGGWGPLGTCICDKYIKGFFDCVYERIGPSYEVISCFVQSSADVRRLSAASLVPQLSALRAPGGLTAGMYFLWPVAWLDGHAGALSADDLAGYIEEDALLKAMSSFENAGIPTRHPHPSHLYRTLCSKIWSAHMCLSSGFHVPATTRINRAMALNDPLVAASCAIDALRALIDEQHQLRHNSDSTKDVSVLPAGPFRGVAKLGFAWEAREVYHFTGEQELAERLQSLVLQDGSTAEALFVQRYVPHDCEIRVYCLHGKPEKLLYTQFGRVNEDGSPSGFRALERQQAVEQWFEGNDKGVSAAEKLILDVLVPRWVRWLRTESCQVPSAIRMDFFVKVAPGGTAEVTIGELTEQGASTLGWEDGARRTFHAIIDSCLLGPVMEAQEKELAPLKRRKQNGNADSAKAAAATD